MTDCTLSTVREGAAAIVALAGELTVTNALDLGRELESAIEPGVETVVLDLGGLTFLDSAGIQLVFRVNRLVGSWGGRLRLVIPTEAPVHRIIRIVDPAGYMPLHATRADALAAAAQSSSAASS